MALALANQKNCSMTLFHGSIWTHPRERHGSGKTDLLPARLDQIVDTNHALSSFGQPLLRGLFRPSLPFDCSSMIRWRRRMGAERLNALRDECLASAMRIGAGKPADFTEAIVDTTV